MTHLLSKIFFLFLFVFVSRVGFSQGIGFEKTLSNQPKEPFTFCLDNTISNLLLLERENMTIKYYSNNWLFITCTPEWINKQYEDKSISSFYFEFAPPVLLNDTSRKHHFVDQIHQGTGGLNQSYTGKNVIVGVVDNGLDYNHPDFKNADGTTRVLKYWDHSFNGSNPPAPYNYGQEWTMNQINSGTITSIDNQGHGTTVAGSVAGNGSANGSNRGMAPEANLVIVQTNFSLPNWTLTIADACDYIFKIAEQENKPAVINLSLGTYLGSHDGNDPASEIMEQLLDNKPGRIIVSAAGNSGNWGKYHVHGNVTADTTFTWFRSNPNGQLGANTIYFDFWTDTAIARTIDFGFGADQVSPQYSLRGQTGFRNLYSNYTTNPTRDTIYNVNNNRIAVIETYRELEGPNFHMEVLFRVVDSTGYNYRLMTKGTGSYDLWSGTQIGLNEIVSILPTSIEMPKIIHYQMPDTLQSIVSSWNCSEKVISVANSKNRQSHVNRNNSIFMSDSRPVGLLSPNSSKGPNRRGITKPDITASGDVALSSGPLSFLNNPANNTTIDSGGWHVRNGGTSMASPIVAGIAALYLEKCPFGTYATFKQLLQAGAYTDTFTGTVPNNAYGYGKAHGLNVLLNATVEPNPTVTQFLDLLTSSPANNYQWLQNGLPLSGATNQSLIIVPPDGDFQVYTVSDDGCPAFSNPYFAVLDIDDLKMNKTLVFPNPTYSEFKIQSEFDIQTISAYDISGKEMTLIKKGKNVFAVDNWPRGAYLLNIQTLERLFQLKLMVK